MEIEAVDAWLGTMGGQYVHVVLIKESDYIMNLMLSYGTTKMIEGTKTKHAYKGRSKDEEKEELMYNKIIANYFLNIIIRLVISTIIVYNHYQLKKPWQQKIEVGVLLLLSRVFLVLMLSESMRFLEITQKVDFGISL